MQELEHQKQALQVMQGAIAESPRGNHFKQARDFAIFAPLR
jgi:hypothetical protein